MWTSSGETMMWYGWERLLVKKPVLPNVIRLSARYNNLNVLEDGYGINLVPLASFAIETYANDPCQCFRVHAQEDSDLREVSLI